MTEDMTEETSQRKVVGRTVAIVLAVICIVLSAGIVAVLAAYLPTQNTINSLNAQVSTQNATITTQSQQIAALQSAIAQLSSNRGTGTYTQEDIDALNDYANNLLNLLMLNASGLLLQNQAVQLQANDNASVWNDYVDYAGYVVVQVQSSSNTTFANLVYSTAYGVNYNEVVVVGTSGVAAFPVLPGNIDVRIGNTETTNAVTATATAVYYY